MSKEKGLSRLLNFIFILAFVSFLTVLAILVKFGSDLPSYEQLKSYTPKITTRLYASDGSLISEYSMEKRIFVPIEIIPKHLINAFLAAEDSNFYNHPGIDPVAIIRTILGNASSVVQGEKNIGGASTITQQVVKNFLLSSERTYTRKIKEAILAVKMTKAFTKDQILELYLNQIYLGSSAYGVAAAAQVYFDKSIDELSTEEMALLATLPKAPSKLDPRKNIEKAKERRDWVLQRMIEEKFISEKEGKEAMQKPIVLSSKNTIAQVEASYFSDAVKKELGELYGSDKIFEEGIVVKTTLDTKLQEYANQALQKGIEDYDLKHGWRGSLGKIKAEDLEKDWHNKVRNFKMKRLYKASWRKAVVLSVDANKAEIGTESNERGTIPLSEVKWAKKYIGPEVVGPEIKAVTDVLAVGNVVMVEKIKSDQNLFHLRQIPDVNGAFIALDPHSGRVLAMVGGYVDAINQFNRSTQAKRQPGSTLKTFGYIAAMENGMNPATIIMDEPILLDQGPASPPYEPRNYYDEFYGPTTLRKGLEQSINVTTVRMADQVGLDKVSDVIKRFGVNEHPRDYYSAVLGGVETTLINLTSAYGMIVNGGKEIKPSLIEKIQDRNGKTIYRRQNQECKECVLNVENNMLLRDENIVLPVIFEKRVRVTDSATAFQITSMLEGAAKRGTSARATKEIGKTIGGKTGTTNNSIDSWYVGFSPDLVAGVYVGFDIPRTLGAHETGASVALPIFIDFMKNALKETPPTPFRVPDSVKFVKIDRSTGKYPTPETPKDKIFFEVFKTTENVDKELSNDYDNNYSPTIEGDENSEVVPNSDNTGPSGIY